MKKITILVILFVMLVAGCSKRANTDPSQPLPPKPTESDKLQKQTEKNKQPEQLKDSCWLIQVSDSKKGSIPVPMSNKSLDFTITVHIVAWKSEGADIYGKYKGRGLITMDFDEGKLSDENYIFAGNVLTDSLMEDMNFEIVPYNKDQYDKSTKSMSDDLSLAPLSTFNGMSVFRTNISTAKWEAVKAIDKETGKIVYNVNSGTSDAGKVPIGINLLINDEKITVDIPTYNSAWTKLDFFRGKIIKNTENLDPIESFRDILITRMEQRQSLAENAEKNMPSSEPIDQQGTTGGYITDEEGREGFDTNNDGKLDIWFDEDGNVRMDLNGDGEWDPPIEGEYSDGALK